MSKRPTFQPSNRTFRKRSHADRKQITLDTTHAALRASHGKRVHRVSRASRPLPASAPAPRRAAGSGGGPHASHAHATGLLRYVRRERTLGRGSLQIQTWHTTTSCIALSFTKLTQQIRLSPAPPGCSPHDNLQLLHDRAVPSVA